MHKPAETLTGVAHQVGPSLSANQRRCELVLLTLLEQPDFIYDNRRQPLREALQIAPMPWSSTMNTIREHDVIDLYKIHPEARKLVAMGINAVALAETDLTYVTERVTERFEQRLETDPETQLQKTQAAGARLVEHALTIPEADSQEHRAKPGSPKDKVVIIFFKVDGNRISLHTTVDGLAKLEDTHRLLLGLGHALSFTKSDEQKIAHMLRIFNKGRKGDQQIALPELEKKIKAAQRAGYLAEDDQGLGFGPKAATYLKDNQPKPRWNAKAV